jgi:hypothetical protein
MLAVTGLAICIFGTIAIFHRGASRSKSVLILIIGLVLASPALWLAYEVFEVEIEA